MAVPSLTCMALVASLYNLPPRVLPSIHAVEGGGLATVHVNTDGTEDLGLMQINTRWLPLLARYTRSPEVFVRRNLLERACYNIAAAGLIMRIYPIMYQLPPLSVRPGLAVAYHPVARQ